MSYDMTAPGVWGMRKIINGALAKGDETYEKSLVGIFVLNQGWNTGIANWPLLEAAGRAQEHANV